MAWCVWLHGISSLYQEFDTKSHSSLSIIAIRKIYYIKFIWKIFCFFKFVYAYLNKFCIVSISVFNPDKFLTSIIVLAEVGGGEVWAPGGGAATGGAPTPNYYGNNNMMHAPQQHAPQQHPPYHLNHMQDSMVSTTYMTPWSVPPTGLHGQCNLQDSMVSATSRTPWLVRPTGLHGQCDRQDSMVSATYMTPG